MGKVLVKKVRFVQKKVLPKSAATLRREHSVKEFVQLDFQEESLASN